MQDKDLIIKEIKEHEVAFQIVSEDLVLIENHLARSQ